MHIYAQGSTSFLVSHNIVYMYNFCINSSLHTCITSNNPMRLVPYNRDRCYTKPGYFWQTHVGVSYSR